MLLALLPFACPDVVYVAVALKEVTQCGVKVTAGFAVENFHFLVGHTHIYTPARIHSPPEGAS